MTLQSLPPWALTVGTAALLLLLAIAFVAAAGASIAAAARWWLRKRWDWSPQRPDKVARLAKLWRRLRQRWFLRGRPIPQSRPSWDGRDTYASERRPW
jgi:hypothetical protein